MKVKNLDKVLLQLKPKLKEYLEEQDTTFIKEKFTCPNKKDHKREDVIPSAAFFPDENSFNCFVCHAHGDIINAANYLEGLPTEGSDFINTVITLAQRYGIECQIEEEDADFYNRKIKEMMKLIGQIVYKTYSQQSDMINYVKSRGWENLESKYKFGYCNYQKLVEFLKSKGYTEKDIVDGAGLFEGQFNNRLLIPIYDEYGLLAGFSGRSIDPNCNKSQRYVNSSTSLIYKKQDILFNFNYVRSKFDTIYIVEGYADTLTLIKNGIENVVAICGTALSDKHLQLLVKYKIKKVILCLDNDAAGITETNKLLDILRKIPEFQVYVKSLKKFKEKDPDEFIIKQGVNKFLEQPNQTLFEYKLEQHKQSGMDKTTRAEILSIIVDETSHIEKEHMCKLMAKEIGVKTETVINEIEKLEKVKLGDYDVTTADIINERDSLRKEVILFENWAQTRGDLLGMHMIFPLMTEKLDGLQNGLMIVAAEENVGKSAFVLQIAINVVKANPRKVFVLYFGLDLCNRTLVARIIANSTGIPINAISRPKTHPLIKDNEELQKIRTDAVSNLISFSDSFAIKDESSIRSIEEMERLIKVYQKAYSDRQLIVIVDSLNKMNTRTKSETRDLYMYISDRLKKWTTWFSIPVIAISELRKLPRPGMRPTNDDIKECSDLKYDANCTILLYNELHSRRTSENVFVGKDGKVYPIVEVMVFKNNLSDFKGTLYYKFYTDICKVEEMTIEEHRNLWSKFSG